MLDLRPKPQSLACAPRCLRYVRAVPWERATPGGDERNDGLELGSQDSG